jgi:hypothetical protein
MEAESALERVTCPACGGAGGGPFGPAGSAWDDEEYVCPRCEGLGAIAAGDVMVQSQRPGIVKAVPAEAEPARETRKASA